MGYSRTGLYQSLTWTSEFPTYTSVTGSGVPTGSIYGEHTPTMYPQGGVFMDATITPTTTTTATVYLRVKPKGGKFSGRTFETTETLRTAAGGSTSASRTKFVAGGYEVPVVNTTLNTRVTTKRILPMRGEPVRFEMSMDADNSLSDYRMFASHWVYDFTATGRQGDLL